MITKEDLRKLGYELKKDDSNANKNLNQYTPSVLKYTHSISLIEGTAWIVFPENLNIKSLPFDNIEELRVWYFEKIYLNSISNQ